MAHQAPSSRNSATDYRGRFAPSPSGPLHFGSLVSALASFLHARHRGGNWLVRMENLDPPREQPGADRKILEALEAHGLHWDGCVWYQSERLDAYAQMLADLRRRGLAYPCNCTRKDLRAMGGVYDGRCRQRRTQPEKPFAWRLKLYDLPEAIAGLNETLGFEDLFQGCQQNNLRRDLGDPVIKRKDGLFAYQLAVVADDIAQGITHVIRGSDLLELSVGQLACFYLLGGQPPRFGHVPTAINAAGQKLSKQHGAPALQNHLAGDNLWQALAFLGQNPPLELAGASPGELLEWGRRNWRPDALGVLEKLAPSEFRTESDAGAGVRREEL